MPAQLEEVVVHAHTRRAQQLGPDPGQRLLRGGARGVVRRVRGELRRGEGAPVDLAVRGEGDGGQEHEGRRDHVVRQLLREQGAHARPARASPPRGNHVGHQAPPAGGVVPDDHHGRAHGGGAERVTPPPHRAPRGSPDLHLPVDPAQELHLAVRQPAHPVAGPVQPAPPSPAKGSGSRVAAVSSGRARYPRGTAGPPTNSSPGTPSGTGMSVHGGMYPTTIAPFLQASSTAPAYGFDMTENERKPIVLARRGARLSDGRHPRRVQGGR